MIVVDTNVIAYLLIRGKHSDRAKIALRRDPGWVAPLLWRSEFRNLLAGYMRQGTLSLADALQLLAEAESLLTEGKDPIDSASVLRLVARSRCSAYDCEFVALAQQLGVPLVTCDAQVLTEFPEIAVALDAFIAQQ